MKSVNKKLLTDFPQRNRRKQRDCEGERIQKIYKWWEQNQHRHKQITGSLTSWQLVILETSWAPWQHRMNPARFRSTHTTDSRTNTLTWRWRDGQRGWKKGGKIDYYGFNTCAQPCNEMVKQWLYSKWNVAWSKHGELWGDSRKTMCLGRNFRKCSFSSEASECMNVWLTAAPVTAWRQSVHLHQVKLS